MSIKATKPKFWCGEPPKQCDLCHETISGVFIDGYVRKAGCWGFMCNSCHTLDGAGLGEGRGQRYEQQSNGKWMKVVPNNEWVVCKECEDEFQQPKGRTSKVCLQCVSEAQMNLLGSEDNGGHEREADGV